MENFNHWYQTTYLPESQGQPSISSNTATMDIFNQLSSPSLSPITTIEMHTAGEPTRIIISGYPPLPGTLLQQRALALSTHDHLRRRLLLEPRGHTAMYGAVLIPATELTQSAKSPTAPAHIGVLFLTNDGYSTMCGHATMALGRLLVDTHDAAVFPNRSNLRFDPEAKTTTVVIHAPCGLIDVVVPTNEDGSRSDPKRPVSFLSVASRAIGVGVSVPVPVALRWPEVEKLAREEQATGDGNEDADVDVEIEADFCYGGAYYCIVPMQALGFTGSLMNIDLDAASKATRLLKAAINGNENLRHLFAHEEQEELGFLYGIILVDGIKKTESGDSDKECKGSELGLCFFGDQQVDRSPTGSAVAARVALALAEGKLGFGEKWEYHSVFTRKLGQTGFVGSVQEIRGMRETWPVARVRVEGFAYYTGAQRFVVEAEDPLGDDGFLFEKLVQD